MATEPVATKQKVFIMTKHNIVDESLMGRRIPLATPDAAFAHILQTAYNNVRISNPEYLSVVEEQLITELDSHGISLTSDVVHALSWAAVEGREG